MRSFGRNAASGILAALCLAGLGADEAAALGVTFPLTVEFDEGITGDFGSVTVEERSHGKLEFTIELTSELGSDADLHEFYFNLADSLDIDELRISGSRCREWGEDDLGHCKTDFEIEDDPSVRGGAGSEFDFGVNFGNGGSEKGNGELQMVSFVLSAFADDDDDHKGKDKGKDKGKGKAKGKHEDDDHEGEHEDDDDKVGLAIADLLESSSTKRGLEVYFAVHVQDTDLGGSSSDSETVGAPVPEPGTAALVGLGLAGLAIAGRRRS